MTTAINTARTAENESAGSERLQVHYSPRPPVDVAEEIIAGLESRPRTISPKFFYDSRGAALFDRITLLPEYYPTRIERQIFTRYRKEIAEAVGSNRVLIEPGSGSSEKVELLLDALRPSAYVPLEITESHLLKAANHLIDTYPWLHVHAVCADYSDGLDIPATLPADPRLVFFPGSTIGNFDPAEAEQFLSQLRDAVDDRGALLIGVDNVKDIDILEAAYNDNQGITARFNLNALNHVNRLANGTFDTGKFRHVAFFNRKARRIEMHLQSLCDQTVTLADHSIDFGEGERIHTENSYKYSIHDFHELAQQAGFEPQHTWSDDREWFSVHLLRAA